MPGPIAASVAPTASAPAATIPAARPRQPQCSIATPVGAGEGDREAVGGEDQRRQAGLTTTCPSTSGSSLPGSAKGLGCCGSEWKASSAPWTWSPIGIRVRVEPQRRRQPPRFSITAVGLVLGEDAEVEAVERRLADAAEPGREGGPRAGPSSASSHRTPSLSRHSIRRN